MNLGLNLGLGAGGGVLLPPPGYISYLVGLKADAITILDTVSPLQVDPEPDLVGVNVLEFDGTSDYFDQLGATPAGTFSGRRWVYFDSAQDGVRTIFMNGASKFEAGRLEKNTSNQLILGATTLSLVTTVAPVNLDAWNYLEWYVDGSSSSLTLNSVQRSGAGSVVASDPSGYRSGTHSVLSLYFKGKMSRVEIDGFSSANLAEGIGNPLDTSDNGNLIVLGDGSTASTFPTWVQDLSGQIGSSNHGDGFYRNVTTAQADQPSFVLLGDSLTLQGGLGYDMTPTGTVGYGHSRGYFNWARPYLTGQVWLKANMGVGGERTDQILLRLPAAIAEDSDFISITAGSNDVAQGIAASVIIANLDTMKSDIESAEKVPIFLNVTPSDSYTLGQIDVAKEVNTHIATYENYVDVWSLLVGVDDYPADGTAIDAIHWSERAAELIGRTLAPMIEVLCNPVPFEWHDTTHTSNVSVNPTFEDSASGWTVANGTLGVFTDSESLNNKLLLTSNGGGITVAKYTENISSGLFAVGDTLRMSFDVEWETEEFTTSQSFHPRIQFQQQKSAGAGGALIEPPILGLNLPSGEIVGGMAVRTTGRCTVLTPEFDVAADVDRIYVQLGFDSLPSGATVKVHRYSFWNVTVAASEVYQYVPALDDGLGFAANGLPLTNHGCSDNRAVHNGSEVGILESSATIQDNEFYAPSTVFTAKYYADFLLTEQWKDNMLQQWTPAPCILKKQTIYAQAYSPTQTQFNQGVNWAQKYTSSCGGGVSPFSVAAENGDDLITETGDLIIVE